MRRGVWTHGTEHCLSLISSDPMKEGGPGRTISDGLEGRGWTASGCAPESGSAGVLSRTAGGHTLAEQPSPPAASVDAPWVHLGSTRWLACPQLLGLLLSAKASPDPPAPQPFLCFRRAQPPCISLGSATWVMTPFTLGLKCPPQPVPQTGHMSWWPGPHLHLTEWSSPCQCRLHGFPQWGTLGLY